MGNLCYQLSEGLAYFRYWILKIYLQLYKNLKCILNTWIASEYLKTNVMLVFSQHILVSKNYSELISCVKLLLRWYLLVTDIRTLVLRFAKSRQQNVYLVLVSLVVKSPLFFKFYINIRKHYQEWSFYGATICLFIIINSHRFFRQGSASFADDIFTRRKNLCPWPVTRMP